MKNKIKIIHVGTGNTGIRALEYAIEHPYIELVGLCVNSLQKVGVDAGVLCGGKAIGILGQQDLTGLLQLDADCVLYMATEWGREAQHVLAEMCQILRSGKHLITTTMPPLIYPKGLDQDVYGLLSDACEAGQSAFFCTGIEPGFTADILPLTLSGLCESIDKIHIHEHLNVGAYPEEQQAEIFGFGKSYDLAVRNGPKGLWKMYWSGTMGMLADGLDLKFDVIEEYCDWAVAEKDFDLGWIKIAAGEVGAAYFEIRGIVDGIVKLLISHCYSLHDDISRKWMNPPIANCENYRNTSIRIDGSPDIRLELAINDVKRPIAGSTATAARAVNSVFAVCAAGPGVHSFLDITPIMARGVIC